MEMVENRVCSSCGKPLIFNETLNAYYCIDCNQYFDADEFDKVENDYTGLYYEIICKLCGKTTIVSKSYNYGVCPFCLNNLIDINENITGFAPEVIITFKETPSTFASHLTNILKAGNCPDYLIEGVKPESLKGLYLPFYYYTIENLYRCFLETQEVSNRYGDDGFYYQEISFLDNLNVLCDATRTCPNSVIDDFANYNFNEQKLYLPKLLGDGYYVLKSADTHEHIWKDLKKIVEEYTTNKMDKYRGKTEFVKKMTLYNDTRNITKKYVLLPVWIVETFVNDSTNYIYINGQTHRVASDLTFNQVYKKTLFGKTKVEKFQVQFLDEMKIKYKRFNSGIDYHNEIRKYDGNSASKDKKIGAMRTK